MRHCFVIMPFANEYDSVFSAAIRPAAEANGYRCERADSYSIPQNVPSEVVKAIISSDLVIADISEPSPNVYYELGVSHCVGNKTITITCKVDTLPFDLATWRAIPYRNQTGELDVLRLRLNESIRSQSKIARNQPTNLVQEAGREFFNLRQRIETSLSSLARTITRMEDFGTFLTRGARNDNTEVLKDVVRDCTRSLVGRQRVLISLSGPGAIGKSSFARQLAVELGRQNVSASVLPTDAYMLSRADRLCAGLVGFDIAANDIDKLVADVGDLLRGRTVTIRPYDHHTGEHGDPTQISSADVVILEGIHSFYPGIYPGLGTPWLKYYFYAAPNHAKELKFIADFTERRYDLQTAYEHSQSEYDGYERHVLPYIRHADRIVEVDGYWRYRMRSYEGGE